jgi:hypothetical protein
MSSNVHMKSAPPGLSAHPHMVPSGADVSQQHHYSAVHDLPLTTPAQPLPPDYYTTMPNYSTAHPPAPTSTPSTSQLPSTAPNSFPNLAVGLEERMMVWRETNDTTIPTTKISSISSASTDTTTTTITTATITTSATTDTTTSTAAASSSAELSQYRASVSHSSGNGNGTGREESSSSSASYAEALQAPGSPTSHSQAYSTLFTSQSFLDEIGEGRTKLLEELENG